MRRYKLECLSRLDVSSRDTERTRIALIQAEGKRLTYRRIGA